MSFAHRFVAVLLVLLGAGHTFIAGPMLLNTFSQGAIWYLGAGLGMMVLGLVNLVVHQAVWDWVRWSTVAANSFFLLLMVALLITSNSWRVLLAVAIAAGCCIGSVHDLRLSMKLRR